MGDASVIPFGMCVYVCVAIFFFQAIYNVYFIISSILGGKIGFWGREQIISHT